MQKHDCHKITPKGEKTLGDYYKIKGPGFATSMI